MKNTNSLALMQDVDSYFNVTGSYINKQRVERNVNRANFDEIVNMFTWTNSSNSPAVAKKDVYQCKSG